MKYYTDLNLLRNDIPTGKTITLIGGCFDLLHAGHLHLINYAKQLSDILIVAVLSDRYIKEYKNIKRPIIEQQHRAHLVSQLKPIDFVFLADSSPNGSDTISILKPNNLVFGIDKETFEKKRRKAQLLRSQFPNLRIYFLERFSENSISTTHIIEKVKISS